ERARAEISPAPGSRARSRFRAVQRELRALALGAPRLRLSHRDAGALLLEAKKRQGSLLPPAAIDRLNQRLLDQRRDRHRHREPPPQLGREADVFSRQTDAEAGRRLVVALENDLGKIFAQLMQLRVESPVHAVP